MRQPRTDEHAVSPPLWVIEGGHFHIKRRVAPVSVALTRSQWAEASWEPVRLGEQTLYARVTAGALRTLDAMIDDVRTQQAQGLRVQPMILVNDLAVPPALRPRIVGWPDAIGRRLAASGIEPLMIRESEARNRGRTRARELIDDAESDPEACYARRGYGIVHRMQFDPRARTHKRIRRLLSDVMIEEWSGLKAVTLTHGGTVKCPGILAGVLGLLAARGAVRFRAHYARQDEPDIVAKLRGGFALHALHDPMGLNACDHMVYLGGSDGMRHCHTVDDFRVPGQRDLHWLMNALPGHAPGAGGRGKRRRRGRRLGR